MNHSTVMKRLAATVTSVVIASLAGAVYVLESPMTQRQRRLDEHRLKDLENISKSIQEYAKKHDALPQNMAVLEEAATEAGTRETPTDPVTQEPYEYKVLDAQSYQLCAVFLLPSLDENNRIYYNSWSWSRVHAAGKQCFKYTHKRNSDTGCR